MTRQETNKLREYGLPVKLHFVTSKADKAAVFHVRRRRNESTFEFNARTLKQAKKMLGITARLNPDPNHEKEWFIIGEGKLTRLSP